MKLRLHGDSLRLRLGPSEVAQLTRGEAVTETTCFGPEPWQRLNYSIRADDSVAHPRAEFKDNGVTVRVPASVIHEWARADEVTIEAMQPLDRARFLQLLIEKDFACAHGKESNADVYPNPREIE